MSARDGHDMPQPADDAKQAGKGINAQTGRPSGSESEATAPGISTDKKADDTK